jgi:uncharacterized protein YprB with RNaseH-like and TPR domain
MRTLVFDTESTDLRAIMGRLLCGSFGWVTVDDKGNSKIGKPYTDSIETRPGKSAIDDGPLAVAIRDELESADIIVGWNSKLHDVPLINARLAKVGERPVRVNLHSDVMWYAAGSSMKIGSRKLDNVSKYFNVDDRKTPLDWETWQLAGTGDSAALASVVEHCEYDVTVLGQVLPHMMPYVRTIHK